MNLYETPASIAPPVTLLVGLVSWQAPDGGSSRVGIDDVVLRLE